MNVVISEEYMSTYIILYNIYSCYNITVNNRNHKKVIKHE